MSIELKTLPTGEVVLPDESVVEIWLRRRGFCFPVEQEWPKSYPCIAWVETDCRGDECPVYRYLPDLLTAVSALKEAAAPELSEAGELAKKMGDHFRRNGQLEAGA